MNYDQGVVLVGEAAKAYVEYKYTELYTISIVLLIIVGLIAFGFYKVFND